MLALYITAGIILFIILAVLLIPVDITLELETYGDGRATTRVGWLFGLVKKEIGTGKKKEGKKKPPGKEKEEKKKPEKKRKRDIKTFLSILRIKGLLSRLVKLGRGILGCFRVRELDADLRVGLDDPVDTGIMYGLLHAVLIPSNSPGATRLRIEPVYDRPAFEINLHGTIRVILIQIVSYLLCFVFSRAGLRAIWSMVVSRWR